MRVLRLFSTVLVWLIVSSLGVNAVGATATDLATYSDPGGHVMFRYPVDWDATPNPAINDPGTVVTLEDTNLLIAVHIYSMLPSPQ